MSYMEARLGVDIFCRTKATVRQYVMANRCQVGMSTILVVVMEDVRIIGVGARRRIPEVSKEYCRHGDFGVQRKKAASKRRMCDKSP